MGKVPLLAFLVVVGFWWDQPLVKLLFLPSLLRVKKTLPGVCCDFFPLLLAGVGSGEMCVWEHSPSPAQLAACEHPNWIKAFK